MNSENFSKTHRNDTRLLDQIQLLSGWSMPMIPLEASSSLKTSSRQLIPAHASTGSSQAGGFYIERWGDAPVHSLALAMFAEPEQLHQFEDIGYSHPPFQHCPPSGVGCDYTCNPEVGRMSNSGRRIITYVIMRVRPHCHDYQTQLRMG
jgi:hypothetical protein